MYRYQNFYRCRYRCWFLLKCRFRFFDYYIIFIYMLDQRWSRRQPSRPRTQKNLRPRLGLTSRWQTSLRPRLGVLKTKDTRRKCSPKKNEKKVSKIYSGNLPPSKKVFVQGDIDFRGKIWSSPKKRVFPNFPWGSCQFPSWSEKKVMAMAHF